MKQIIKLINGDKIIAIKIDRRCELMNQIPVKFYLSVTDDTGKVFEIPYESVVSIETTQ
jgi:hypothetical protein